MAWVSIGYWATQYSIGSISLFGTIGLLALLAGLALLVYLVLLAIEAIYALPGGPLWAAIFSLSGGPLWGLSGPRLLGRYWGFLWGLVLDECHTCPSLRTNQLILFHIHQIGIIKHSVNCTYC